MFHSLCTVWHWKSARHIFPTTLLRRVASFGTKWDSVMTPDCSVLALWIQHQENCGEVSTNSTIVQKRCHLLSQCNVCLFWDFFFSFRDMYSARSGLDLSSRMLVTFWTISFAVVDSHSKLWCLNSPLLRYTKRKIVFPATRMLNNWRKFFSQGQKDDKEKEKKNFQATGPS